MKSKKEIEQKISQKIKKQGDEAPSFWTGFSLFGLVGWSVVIPTLIGVSIGVWLDGRYHPKHSWTLMLLVGGLMLGSFTAWFWIERERKNIHKNSNKEDRNDHC